MAKEQRPATSTARESTTSEPSFFNVPAKSKKPRLVPAFTSKSTPAMSFSVPMPAFPEMGPLASDSANTSTPAAPLSVEEQIANLKRHVAELQESLTRNEDNTPARLEELYKLHELIGNVANRSTMAFSASVGGPGPSDGPEAGSTQRSASPSPPSNDLSPVMSQPGDIDQDADVDPDAMVID
jgi:hypothetical protein